LAQGRTNAECRDEGRWLWWNATFLDNLDCNVAALTLQQVALHNVDTLCERFAESRCSLQESLP